MQNAANVSRIAHVNKAQTGSSQAPKFKFGVQVPRNAVHALNLDKLLNQKLWQEAIDKELESINQFKTFRVLEKGEPIPPGYIRIPYHMIFDVKFDGRHKCRLVAGGHRTPDVPAEEVYSGVVSMETIRTAFCHFSYEQPGCLCC